MSVNEKMTAIADRLRLHTGTTDTLSLDEIVTEIDAASMQMYLAIRGMKEFYGAKFPDAFWDVIQIKGQRTDYSSVFMADTFTDESFKPKHKLNVTNARQMFSGNLTITDLSAVDMDFSNCTDFMFAFRSMEKLVKFGDISVVSAMESVDEKGKTIAAVYRPFMTCSALVEVGTVTVAEEITFDNMFVKCNALEKVTFAGCIGQDFVMGHSPLNRASIESLVKCLSKDAEGKSLTLKSGIVNTAFETSSGAGDGENVFLAFVDEYEKDNWDISY